MLCASALHAVGLQADLLARAHLGQQDVLMHEGHPQRPHPVLLVLLKLAVGLVRHLAPTRQPLQLRRHHCASMGPTVRSSDGICTPLSCSLSTSDQVAETVGSYDSRELLQRIG